MKTIFKKNVFILSIAAMGVCVLTNCKPKEKIYPKESYLDDFLSADMLYNGNFHSLAINRDTNHLNVTFDNGPLGKAALVIDATKNESYYFVLNLRLDSLSQLKKGMQFPINYTDNIGSVSCVHMNKQFSEKEYHANSGTLYIDDIFGFDEIKAHFNVNLINGLGDKAVVTNGKVEYD